MKAKRCMGLEGTEPLGFLAALGILELLGRDDQRIKLSWDPDQLTASFSTPDDLDILDLLKIAREQDIRDLKASGWLNEIAEEETKAQKAGAKDRKLHKKRLDFKQAPAEFRAIMRRYATHRLTSDLLAACATGIIPDGGGQQSKPTALHFCAGQVIFMKCALNNIRKVTDDDLKSTIDGPWSYSTKGKDLRWESGAARERALLSFDPSKTKNEICTGANWLAFHALPFFPCVARSGQVVTTGFHGGGKQESFIWPLWSKPASRDEARVLIGLRGLDVISATERDARNIHLILRSEVVRSDQGYGNFSAAAPI